MSPHEDYSSELARAYKRGHPIANPQPGIDRDGQALKPINIGDVGYISHVHGNFIRMFNVHLEPGEDGQPGLDDLPDGFEPLPMRQTSLLHNKTPIFKSRSVSVKSLSTNASGPFLGGSVAFSTSSERGAILATPDSIHCYDAQHILSYKIHAKENIEHWHEFAVQRLGVEILLEDVILVTGVDRTTSWATAIFTNAHLEADFGLEVQYAGVGARLAAQFAWRNTQGALVNSGPNNDLSANGNVGPAQGPLNTASDQSLFIRHIRGKRRRWLGLKIVANGQVEDDDGSDYSSNDDGKVPSSDDSLHISSSPEHKEFSDCLDPVLDYILQNSSADIAIAHDNDLDLLPAALQGADHTVIHVEDGVGVLRKPETHPAERLQPSTLEDDLLRPGSSIHVEDDELAEASPRHATSINQTESSDSKMFAFTSTDDNDSGHSSSSRPAPTSMISSLPRGVNHTASSPISIGMSLSTVLRSPLETAYPTHESSPRDPAVTMKSPAYASNPLATQIQQHSYSNDEFALMRGYPHPAAPAPSASWFMTGSPPSPINLGRPTSAELSSSPTNAYWPPVPAPSESSYMHSGLMSRDVAMSAYYGQAPQRPITPESPSIASTPSLATDRSLSASTGPNRRRGVSESIDPQEYERQRMKKKDYAKTFRDNEKYHFEQLRRRLFPTDPNTRRAECLERAVSAMDELETYKARAIQREAEVEKLRDELDAANRRTAELEQLVAQTRAGTSRVQDMSQDYTSQPGWR